MAKPASRVLRTGGLLFNGINGRVEIPHSSSLMVTTDFTIMCWVKALRRSMHQYLITKRSDGGGTKGYSLLISSYDSFLGVMDDGSGAMVTESTTEVAVNTWCHVSYVRMNNTQGIYVDGKLEKTTNYTVGDISNTEPLKIGVRGDYINYLKGIIDEVRIYSRVLSNSEIYEIYSKGTFIKDGLVLCLPFYEGEDNVAHDVSGYGNHGTIYGGAMWVVKKALRVLPKAR